jgi:NADP-dependent 3-hydroxy acid dehydrogenase YdfG
MALAPRSILLSGASSGIGAALALAYAAPGATLALSGRDVDRLARVEEACRARGAAVSSTIVDVTDQASMAKWIDAADRATPLDLVIANAGISAGTGGRGESEERSRQIFAVNVDGVLNTAYPALRHLTARGHGQLALVSSLAAFRGFPGGPSYSASKAAVKALGEAWRIELAPRGVRVSVICPGFVETPMTAVNRFRMPFLMGPERAAAIIVRGLARDRARIAFPAPMHLGAWLAGVLPPTVADPVLRRRWLRDG